MAAAIRVLYVDDESDLLDIVKMFLEETGDFSVTTIDSAPAALALLKEKQFDAIISDYQMPVMDGIQFLVEVRTRFGKVPFILFTGKGREEVVIQAINSGADFYLQKGGEPVAQFAELSHKVKKAVEGQRAEEADRASRDRLIRSEANLTTHKTELEAQADELRRAKLALEESRDKFLDLYDFAPLGYLTLSEKALITNMNLTGAKLILVERSRLDKAPFSKFVSEKDADEWHWYFLNLQNQEEKRSCTLLLTRSDGSCFPARLEGIRITGSDGTNTVRIAFTDISDIRHAEETLRDSEKKFRSLAESSPDYIMRYDRQCRHTYMNPAALRVLGLTEGQIIGKTHRDSGFDEPRSRFYEEKITGVFETGKPFQTQFAWDSAGGRVVLDWMLTPEFSDDGTVRSVLGVSRDITQLKSAEDELLRQNEELHASYEEITTTEEELRRNLVELAQQEEALRESEQKLNSILNNITDVVWSLSWPEMNVHYISPSAEQVYGRPVQEFINRPSLWAEIMHPDDRYLSKKALDDLQNGGSAVRECRIVRPDGSIVWIHDRSKFIYDEHGIPVRVEGITSDITGRKRVQESLAESESFNRNLVENLPEYIAVYGMDGKLLYVNPASARTLGYDAETLIGKHVLSYIAEDYHETVIAKMTVRREGGEASPYEIEMVTRNGSRRSVIVKAAPIHYKNYPATLLLLIDITERKQAEEALRQLSDRLSLATRAGGVGIWDYDVVNNTLTWDDQMFALYGITKEQFGGAYEAWQAGLPPQDKQRCDDEVQMALRGEREFDTEFCVLWPDGSIRNIRAFALVQRDARGKPLRMIGTNWDITERNELETEMKYHEQELMQLSKSLAAANKKLTLLSSITRHDINNQLTVLMGFLAILKKKHPGTFTDEYFQKINAAAERISSMIQFTREYENIGINAPVWQDSHTLVDTAAKEAPLGKVMVVNDLPEGGEVFADQLITKVFYNLMDNAVRYGGKITTIRFSAGDSGDEHLIICADDGVGIPVDEKKKIFERGFGKNTGLGLFLSREILDITGITIRETGEPGKGARFEMTVPKGMWRMAGSRD